MSRPLPAAAKAEVRGTSPPGNAFSRGPLLAGALAGGTSLPWSTCVPQGLQGLRRGVCPIASTEKGVVLPALLARDIFWLLWLGDGVAAVLLRERPAARRVGCMPDLQQAAGCMAPAHNRLSLRCLVCWSTITSTAHVVFVIRGHQEESQLCL